ncbi:MAG TPA: Yip1 family protein [Ktedonobacterales bacterium]
MTSVTGRDPTQDTLESEAGNVEDVAGGAQTGKKEETALPLPGWLTKAYFLFPIILYIPDAIFNYYVYSDGVATTSHDPFVQAFWSAVWGFVAIGVVGMAYLLSVLAPWHWSQGHYFQAFFCAVGVIIATLITTWNSLAFRSTSFATFKTDQWVYTLFPQLQTMHGSDFSVTMVLVSVAPPFWGLFWAIVQPIEKNRSLRHMRESHAERLLRLQQEAEVKRLKAETNARIREAQLRGMAQTAAAAREQAAGLMSRGKTVSTGPALPAASAPAQLTIAAPASASSTHSSEPTPLFTPSRGREMPGGRRIAEGREMYNHASPAAGPHAEPDVEAAAAYAQPALLSDAARPGAPVADVDASWSGRPRPTVGAGLAAFFPDDTDVTGTTGPRPVVRRAAEVSSLLQVMNAPHAPVVKQVEEVIASLRASGIARPTPRDVIPALVQRYNVGEDTARKMAATYKAAQKASRE